MITFISGFQRSSRHRLAVRRRMFALHTLFSRFAILPIVLIVLIVLASAQPAFAEEPPPPPVAPVAEEINRLLQHRDISDIRGVNYVHTTADDPAICPDLQFGQDSNCPWDIAAIEADMKRLQRHGVNTLRIFLNYYTFGGAQLTNPDYSMDTALAHLDAFIALANEHGMHVMPILLSKYPQHHGFQPDYYETALKLHVRPVVSHLAGKPGIIAWDLFNEPDIGSPIDQRCWDWSNGDFPPCFQLANERIHFLRVVRQEVQRLDPGRPITVSLAFGKNYFYPKGTDLYMADLVDFFSFHYYDNEPYDSGRYAEHWYYGQGFTADLERAITELIALDPNKPILISELGFPSGPGHLRTYEQFRSDISVAFRLSQHGYNCGLMLWPFQREPEHLIGDLYW